MGDVLIVDDLTISYNAIKDSIVAVDDVSFSVPRGTIVGLVGETGSGKSTIARSALALLDKNANVRKGAVYVPVDNILSATGSKLRKLRSQIGYVGQSPFGSLHPILPIGKQFYDKLRTKGSVTRSESDTIAAELFTSVGLRNPKDIVHSRVHQLSGGMAQRVVIAFALANDPELIIADEPTTALDVTVQRQILLLLRRLVQERSVGILLVTHDLSVVGEYCERIVVLKEGQVVDAGLVSTVMKNPTHPYTQSLLDETRRDLRASAR